MNDALAGLRHAITALENQRAALGDATLALVLAPLQRELARLLAEPAAQRLRQVSVLFIDVIGSTAFSRQLDPEDVQEVLDGALASYTEAVGAQGGSVLQYAGDSLLAVFGSPLAHEDDAARAVHAALAVLALAREQAAAVLRRHGQQGFGVRAGIATGPALLGGGVDGEHAIRGSVVNLAARMEQSAPPGGLRICADTRRLVRGQFDLRDEPPLALKGFEAPVASWLVEGARAGGPLQAARGVGGISAPLVGRRAELAALQQLYSARCAGRCEAPAVALVVGEAGLGKSRLAAELRVWTQSRPRAALWLTAQAGERDAGRPYGLLREVFTRHLRILDSDAPALARARWLQAMSPLLPAAGDAAVLGHLLGLDFAAHDEVRALLSDSRQLRDRGFFHAAQALRGIASDDAPLVLLIDDLQWSDAGTLDFVEHLQHAVADAPLLLLCMTRPTLDEERPGWATAAGRLRIELAPLDDAAALDLADALLARLAEAPEALRERLIAGAAGNPYYMEELVNTLIDRGVIEVHATGWRLGPQPLDTAALPRTLTGVLQARLDHLAPGQAQALEMAAVVGPVFWDGALRALGVADAAVLAPLVLRQLVVPRPGSRLEGQQEYAFRHHLLHQVCYERLLRRAREPAHALVAQWLAAQPGARPLDLIAEHHERGGQPLQALQAWHEAAEAARTRYANAQALAHAARALALTDADDLARLYALTLLRAQVLGLLMEPQPLQQALDELDRLAEQLGDDARRSEAADRRARYLHESGQASLALTVAERALALAPPTQPRLAAHAGVVILEALARLGRHDEAHQRAGAIAAWAGAAGDEVLEGRIFNALGMIADEQGDTSAASTLYRRALERHRAAGNRSHEAAVQSNIGYAHFVLGDYDAAAAQFEQAQATFARIGQRDKAGIVLINQALVALNCGQPGHAQDRAQQALPLLRGAGSRWAAAAAQRVLGQALAAQGQVAQAAAQLAAARAEFEALGLPQLALEARAYQALNALAEGDAAGAQAHARQVLQQLQAGVSLDGTEEPQKVLLACWRVLQGTGDAAAAQVLAQGRTRLLERAARIGDTQQRASFLQRVPHHRELLAAAGGG